jgi:hypothetical protein
LFCAIAILAAWCLFPTRAQANCGHYVVVVNPSAEYLRNRPIEHPMQSGNPACPCHGPQCRASDSTPAMPVPAQITPDYGMMLVANGEASASALFGSANCDDWSIVSEAYHLLPDPPPRSRS